MDIILIVTQDVPLKSRYEKISLCIGLDTNIYFLITPAVAYAKTYVETTYYSQKYSQTMVTLCQSVDKSIPMLIPVIIPMKLGGELDRISDSILNNFEVPFYPNDNPKNIIKDIFSSISYIDEKDKPPSSIYNTYPIRTKYEMDTSLSLMHNYQIGELGNDVGIILKRININKSPQGELKVRNAIAKKTIETYHTCLLLQKPKPYSLIESIKLKRKLVNSFKS